jgi:hypothetical protein
MRPVYFVKYYDKGSTVLAGDQIAAALRDAGVTSRTIGPRDLPSVSDAILVFIKTSRWLDLLRARRRRNRLVLDVHDTVVFKRRIKHALAFDGLIFRSVRALRDFGSSRRLDRVIYHQGDPRYGPHAAGAGGLRVAYFGQERSFPLWNQVPGVDCYSPGGDCFPDAFFEHARRYNCHLSVRRPGRESRYKGNAKVSTAAVCEASLVTTRDDAAVELLGDDYPYFTGPELASVVETVDLVRRTFNGPAWRESLDRLRTVKARTSLPRIRDEYLRYFEELG